MFHPTAPCTVLFQAAVHDAFKELLERMSVVVTETRVSLLAEAGNSPVAV